jgi:transposase
MLNDQDSTGLGISGTCKRQEQSEREVMTMPLGVTPDQRQGREFVRREIVRHVEQGMTATEAQRLCPVPLHRTTVYRLLKRVEREGEQALAEQRHGHPVKLRGEALTFLLDYCQSHPAITSREVQKRLSERFGLAVSVSQLNRVRAAHGLSRKALSSEKKAANEWYHCLWIS